MISLKDVQYSYVNRQQRVDAVRGVTCDFEMGKLYALQGPSGSGKSTLLSLLAALDKPTSGEILWDGQSIYDIPPDRYRRTQVSIIFQAYNLLPYASVIENVAYPAMLQGAKKGDALARATALLKKVGLDESYSQRKPHMLSGGEQQRVAISRSLCSNALVILADEPTGNLDGDNAESIREILVRLAHEEGRAVIMATHNPDMAVGADVHMRMRSGVISEWLPESAPNPS